MVWLLLSAITTPFWLKPKPTSKKGVFIDEGHNHTILALTKTNQ
jgi:hypothetical protein